MDQLEPEQDLPERLPRAPLLLERASKPLLGKMPLLYEALTERFSSPWRHGFRFSGDGMGIRMPDWDRAFSSQISAEVGRI